MEGRKIQKSGKRMQQGSLQVSRGAERVLLFPIARQRIAFEETRKTESSSSCLQSNSTNISPRSNSLLSFLSFISIVKGLDRGNNSRKLKIFLQRGNLKTLI